MFKKATKKQAKLRAALFGPSGAGKTFTGLRIATGLGGKIAVIDTERKSASKYADMTEEDARTRGLLKPFEFDTCELDDKSIDGYCEAIQAASRDYDILVIDSLSHGWQQLLERVEKLAQAKYKGNTWSAWSEGTPEQRQLVDAILDFPGHVIATMRSKTEWTTVQQSNGKSAPIRVGLAPEQGKGIEYEFDLLLELSVDHVCNVLKDRTGKFQDKLIDKPGEDFGKSLAEWLNNGERIPTQSEKDEAERQLRIEGRTKAAMEACPENVPAPTWLKGYATEASKMCVGHPARESLADMSIEELKICTTKHAEIVKILNA